MSVEQFFKKYTQLNPEAKQQIDDLLEQLMATQVKDEDKRPPSLFGIWKGQIEMAPDFDEPLEDFKDYM